MKLKELKKKIHKLISPSYRKLLKTEKMLSQYSEKYRYFISVANAGKIFGYNFKEYFIKENMPERILELKKGLDEKSIEVVDNKINHFLNIPLYGTDFVEHCRFDTRDVLYTKEELEENKKYLVELPKLKEKYKGDYQGLSPEVFYYHHGLKFLSKEQLKYIENKDFIDVGAFWGDSSVALNEYNPHHVFSFEICTNAKEKYYSNLKLNNIDINKFEFINFGVSDKKSSIIVNNNETKTSLSRGGGTETTEISIVTLDNYFKDNSNIGLIKMDIEGAEYDAIVGAKDLITKNKPIMCITIYHTPKQFFELKPLIESWNLGYSFIIRNLNFYSESELETTLICIPQNI